MNAIWKVSLKKDKNNNENKSLVFRTFGMKFDEKEMAKKVADLSEKGKLNEETKQEPDDQLLFSRLSGSKMTMNQKNRL